MPGNDWLLIFRGYLTGDLLALQTKLQGQVTTITSMSVGQKSFSRDLRELRDQLWAIRFVLNERSGGTKGYEGAIVPDFSGSTRGQPAGSTEQLNF